MAFVDGQFVKLRLSSLALVHSFVRSFGQNNALALAWAFGGRQTICASHV